jgi:hypothetical protein
MLAVPYFEKALYELPEDQLTPDTLLALADEIEVRSHETDAAVAWHTPPTWGVHTLIPAWSRS